MRDAKDAGLSTKIAPEDSDFNHFMSFLQEDFIATL